jgi:hypothetical protein
MAGNQPDPGLGYITKYFVDGWNAMRASGTAAYKLGSHTAAVASAFKSTLGQIDLNSTQEEFLAKFKQNLPETTNKAQIYKDFVGVLLPLFEFAKTQALPNTIVWRMADLIISNPKEYIGLQVATYAATGSSNPDLATGIMYAEQQARKVAAGKIEPETLIAFLTAGFFIYMTARAHLENQARQTEQTAPNAEKSTKTGMKRS